MDYLTEIKAFIDEIDAKVKAGEITVEEALDQINARRAQNQEEITKGEQYARDVLGVEPKMVKGMVVLTPIKQP